jgi:hypothetical protein
MPVLEQAEPMRLDELDKGIRIPREIFEVWLEAWERK